MTITESKQGNITILLVQGRLDATTGSDLDRHLGTLIGGGALHVVLNLSGLEYVSSAGLRVFLSAAKRMKQAQGKLALASPGPQVQQILDVAGFSSVLPVFASLVEAIGKSADAEASTPEPLPGVHGMLSVAEEIFLLALDDSQGLTKRLPTFALDYALAAALLMELALRDRVDTDLTTLKVTSVVPTGDPLLDETLLELQKQAKPQLTSFWLERLTIREGQIGERVLARLVKKGLLKQENRRILWVFNVRRYPLIDDREVKEVRTRLRELILSDEIPDPRELVLISLGNACRLLEDLFPAKEFTTQVQTRIAALARLDLIGQAMGKCIREIENAMAVMSMP